MTTKRAAKAAPKKSATKKKPAKKAAGKVGGFREGAGRKPSIGKSGADVAKGQRLPAELVARVEKRMSGVGCNWSDAVRQGLELWLRE